MKNVRRLADLLVFVGPSGCGKSTIIQKLQAEFPDIFSFSTSHTTRPPREGEVNGRDYYFISKRKFESLLASKAFIEYTALQTSAASAAGEGEAEREESTVNYYGTSKAALQNVLIRNKVVLMDTDVLGAINIRRYCEGNLAPVSPRTAAAAPAPAVECSAGTPPPPLLHSSSSSATASTSGNRNAVTVETLAKRGQRPDMVPSADGSAEKSNDGESTEQQQQQLLHHEKPPHWPKCKVIFIAPPSVEELARRLRARKSESEETLQRRLRLGEEWMVWARTNEGFFDHQVVNDNLEACYQRVRTVILDEVISFDSSL